jgi:glyoxylase I family protein
MEGPMRVEHIALNVHDPNAMARWYVDHLGFTIKRRVMEPPWAHFLVDEHGTFMLEIYGNQNFPIPDYAATPPATLHLAFLADDIEAEIARLVRAGATLVGNGVVSLPGGDAMAFLRDPWGLTLQLVKRAQPML